MALNCHTTLFVEFYSTIDNQVKTGRLFLLRILQKNMIHDIPAASLLELN